MLPALTRRSIDAEIERLHAAHCGDRREIGRLIVLLADRAARHDASGAEATLERYRSMMCMMVLEFLLLSVRFPGADRVRPIDVFPELPGMCVVEGVFSPEFATDSYLWARHIAARGGVDGKSVLEMGAGSGVISLYFALTSDPRHITAVDINPAAVENLRLNRDHFRLDPARFEIVESDLFELVAPRQRFDLILWAMPWVYLDDPAAIDLVERTRDPVMRRLLHSVVDIRLESIRRFISQAKARLAPGGSLLLITSDFCRNDLIEVHARREGLRYALELFAHDENVVPRVGMVLNLYQIRLTLP